MNEIKKELYKRKPNAKFLMIRLGNAYYETKFENTIVTFCVPISNIGNIEFKSYMKASLLIKWISNVEIND